MLFRSGEKMKTTESICPKSWEQTLSLERTVGSSSQAESVRTWLSLSQEEGGSFKIRTAGLKVCTCSQRGKKPEILTGDDYFWLSAYRVLVSEVAQSCPTLSNTMDCSPPGSSIHGIFQAKVLESGAITFSVFLPSLPHISRKELPLTQVLQPKPLEMRPYLG